MSRHVLKPVLHQNVAAMAFERKIDLDVKNPSVVLVSYTMPWTETSLIDFLHSAAAVPCVYWESGASALGFAGYGAAAVLTAAGPNRFQIIREKTSRLFEQAVQNAIDAPEIIGPRLFGGFAFDSAYVPQGIWSGFPAAYFVLPRYQLTRWAGCTWLTVNRVVPFDSSLTWQTNRMNGCNSVNGYRTMHAEVPSLIETDLQWLQSRMCKPLLLNCAEERHSCDSRLHVDVNCQVEAERWHDCIDDAVRRIQEGELEKVVLSRTCDVKAERPIRPTAVLAKLQHQYPDCYRFLIEPAPGNAFFGATPELLVEVSGTEIHAVALAGSIGRGDTSEADVTLGQALLFSPKDRQEHAFVVQAIDATLRPLTRRLNVPTQPTLRRLRNIQHLQTTISGDLNMGIDILSAVDALHPTPAVGGVPQEPALQMILETELHSRGWYASPVGWITPQGDGLFNVAIRSAVSHANRARVYAGAGIVADSDPDAEWEETRLKMQPMLEALGTISGP